MLWAMGGLFLPRLPCLLPCVQGAGSQAVRPTVRKTFMVDELPKPVKTNLNGHITLKSNPGKGV